MIHYARLEEEPNLVTGGVNRLFRGVFHGSDGARIDGYLKDLTWRQIVRELAAVILARGVKVPVAPDDPNGSGGKLLFGTGDAGSPLAGAVPQISFSQAENSAAAVKIMDDQLKALQDRLRRWSCADAAVLFDDWIANSDRHMKNIMIKEEPDKYVLIDHEDAFGGRSGDFHDLDSEANIQNNLLDWLWLGGGMATTANNAVTEFNRISTGNWWRADLDGVFDFHRESANLFPDDLRRFITDRRNGMVKRIAGRIGSGGSVARSGSNIRQKQRLCLLGADLRRTDSGRRRVRRGRCRGRR